MFRIVAKTTLGIFGLAHIVGLLRGGQKYVNAPGPISYFLWPIFPMIVIPASPFFVYGFARNKWETVTEKTILPIDARIMVALGLGILRCSLAPYIYIAERECKIFGWGIHDIAINIANDKTDDNKTSNKTSLYITTGESKIFGHGVTTNITNDLDRVNYVHTDKSS